MALEICEQIVEGNVTAIKDCVFAQAFLGGAFSAIVVFGILVAIFLLIAGYVYHALAWMTIARKLKYKRAWLAWIPFAGTAMRLQLGGFHWAWVFLYLIPVLGWIAIIVLLIISAWKIFEKRKYPGWFGLAMILPSVGGPLYLIIIGFVAWKDRKKMLFT